MTQPYDPPQSSEQIDSTPDTPASVRGGLAIWCVAGISFCVGAVALFGAFAFLRTPELLAGLTGGIYFYYLLRPFALAFAFFGLAWKCLRYVDAITHSPFDSPVVHGAHGRIWNWMAVMLVAFVLMAAYHSFGG